MSKVISGGCVNVTHPETYELHTFCHGDRLPKWAESIVTNPALFASDDASHDDGNAGSTPDGQGAPAGTASAPAFVLGDTVAALKDRAKALGIATSGSKQDLADRITAKLAADAAEQPAPAGDPAGDGADPGAQGAGDGDNGAPASGDTAGTERAALIARLEELGIEHDPEHSDDEIVALIEAAQE